MIFIYIYIYIYIYSYLFSFEVEYSYIWKTKEKKYKYSSNRQNLRSYARMSYDTNLLSNNVKQTFKNDLVYYLINLVCYHRIVTIRGHKISHKYNSISFYTSRLVYNDVCYPVFERALFLMNYIILIFFISHVFFIPLLKSTHNVYVI